MIWKGIVEELDSNSPKVRVRIPQVHKLAGVKGATPSSELPMAPICLPPNIHYIPHIGDTVIVGYQTDEKNNPIILGVLYKKKNNTDTLSNIKCSKLEIPDVAGVETKVKLCKNTQIGDISYKELCCLDRMVDNIKDTFDKVKSDIKKLEGNVDGENGLQKQVSSLNTTLGEIKDSQKSIKSRLSNIESTIDELKSSMLDKDKPILGTGAYGKKLPDSGDDGQLYLLISD